MKFSTEKEKMTQLRSEYRAHLKLIEYVEIKLT